MTSCHRVKWVTRVHVKRSIYASMLACNMMTYMHTHRIILALAFIVSSCCAANENALQEKPIGSGPVFYEISFEESEWTDDGGVTVHEPPPQQLKPNDPKSDDWDPMNGKL